MEPCRSAEPERTPSRKSHQRPVVIGLIVGIGLAALLVPAVYWALRQSPSTSTSLPMLDPRLSFPTPYRNVRPGVKYVDDNNCTVCHPAETKTYRQHPMGRSFEPVARVAGQLRFGPEAKNPFDSFGCQFLVENRGGRMFQQEIRHNSKGTVTSQQEEEIQFVLGSGLHGRAFLFEREGYLFQAPISWFSQGDFWGLSPGFNESAFSGRPIRVACLACHANPVEPVKDTENRYQTPIFRHGYAIGCQRCHGPGELHVQRRQNREVVADQDASGQVTGPFDNTIVNPVRLPPALREAVCQQCHLLGFSRIDKRGRGPFDYRPGLPLYLFRSIFEPAPELADEHQAVGHVEQMYASRCFRGSGGKLGCISCHDPHALPAPAERIRFYRNRCLQCHQEQSCSLSPAVRRRTTKEDSCIHCHMPESPNPNISHATATDHRILRRPEKGRRNNPKQLRSGQMPLVNFYQDFIDPSDEGARRDLGLALVQFASSKPAWAKRAAAQAAPLLENAVAADPDDLPAWEGKSDVDWLLGRQAQALADLETALQKSPRREPTLFDAAFRATTLGHRADAIGYWQRAIEVDPWSFPYHARLAELLVDSQAWPQAVKTCQAALRLNPASARLRLLLVLGHVKLGNKEKARTEFQTLLTLEPAKEKELRRWFAQQAQ